MERRITLAAGKVVFAVGIALLAILSASGNCAGGEDPLTRVTFKGKDRQTRTVEGKVLVEAVDQGFLLMGRDGQLWSITPDRLQQREATTETFQPLAGKELGAALVDEFGARFEIHETKHYIICSDTGKKYANWCGILFERLLAGFEKYWRKSKLQMHEPEMPLVAVVFANREQFAEYATRDAGPAIADSQGYYSSRSNRIILYDLTAELKGRRAGSGNDVNRLLSTSLSNVATVVHEATHQIAFNSGLHSRYADNPLWLVEGMATYFETPDMRNRSGWKAMGRINTARLQAFANYVNAGRPKDSLETLISSNERLVTPETGVDAYGEAWALTYFLIKTKRKQYSEYLQLISQKRPLVFQSPEQRLAEFRSVFGDDLDKLDQSFLRYMSRKK